MRREIALILLFWRTCKSTIHTHSKLYIKGQNIFGSIL